MSTPLEQELAVASPSVLVEPTDSPWQSLDPRSIVVERIADWIFSVVVAIVCLAAGVAIYLANKPPGPITYTVLCGLVLLVLVGSVVGHMLPKIAYRHTRYRLSTMGFEIQRGILWRTRITIPISRVQHTDVSQGPLQRRFSIGKLVVYTAGTQYASVELDGLNFDLASRLRDAIVAGRESIDGV